MNNITMIGAPSSGKSTIGVLLAKRLGMNFVDLDIVIQEEQGKLLSELISEMGQQKFLNLEEDTACRLNVSDSVIAPGGSICHEPKAMEHLKNVSTVIYLYIPFEEMCHRIGDFVARGVVVPDGYTIEQLYKERADLYAKYADITIDETGKEFDEILDELLQILKK